MNAMQRRLLERRAERRRADLQKPSTIEEMKRGRP
jgi:hypothetical protein